MTVGVAVVPEQTEFLAGLWKPKFPSAEMVGVAAALVPGIAEVAGSNATLAEGPRWEFVVAPGALQVRTRDWVKYTRTAERQQRQGIVDTDQLAAWIKVSGSLPADPISTRRITSWSRSSRANMVKTFCQLDYSPMFADPTRMPAMITLTYPGDWEVVVPCGKAGKAHLKALRKRWQRAWNEDPWALWKQEFQRRGAPHYHLLMCPPQGESADGLHFRAWLSKAWAEIVGHPDPDEFHRHLCSGTAVDYADGLRASDPKRIAVYFTKHGSFKAKEYQNCVPEQWQHPDRGPGRFWGAWKLKPARVGVLLNPQDGVRVGRLLRRWARAQGTTREVTVKRTKGGAVLSAYSDVIGLAGAGVLESRKARYRSSRVRVKRLPACRGWVSVNDGAEFCSQMARWLTLAEDTGVQQGRKGSVMGRNAQQRRVKQGKPAKPERVDRAAEQAAIDAELTRLASLPLVPCEKCHDGVRHCDGILVEHADGVDECSFHSECMAPDGDHAEYVACEDMEDEIEDYSHRCVACSG